MNNWRNAAIHYLRAMHEMDHVQEALCAAGAEDLARGIYNQTVPATIALAAILPDEVRDGVADGTITAESETTPAGA